MDVYKNIRIHPNKNMPPGSFLLLSESDAPCLFCNAVPTFQLADASRVVRVCFKCERHWDFKRTDEAEDDAP